ncbi:hypothetical protein X943_003697 [Babesia divergens]|uniref:Thioredoxin domain-containing protein n=1 Tax=Babesia divergens TaxID=32595 RepID=A0AAD9GJR0_BABDI|nr:hypothetical protein X943_003697 [Babesia divergens]
MLYVSRFKLLWVKLPSHQLLKSESMLLHLYSDLAIKSGTSAKFLAGLVNDPVVQGIVKEHKIRCYTEDVKQLHPEDLHRLGITTAPIVVGIHDGRSVGACTGASDLSDATDLCRRLVAVQNPTSDPSEEAFYSAIDAQTRAIISESTKEDALASLSHLKKGYIQRLEVDDKLRRLFALAQLHLYNPTSQRNTSCRDAAAIHVLEAHLHKINYIIAKISEANVDGIIAWYNSHVSPDTLQLESAKFHMTSHKDNGNANGLNQEYAFNMHQEAGQYGTSGVTHVSKLLKEFVEENQYGCVISSERTTDITRAMFLKVWIMQNISVALYFKECVTESLNMAVEAYECLVAMLKKDLISLREFEQHEIGRIIELLFDALPYNHPAVLGARASLETVDGPRLLNRIPEGSRPLGGPVSKRRGFRGRYLWHGPDYRPKKYKPKDPEQYLNEWRYQPDRNLPTF